MEIYNIYTTSPSKPYKHGILLLSFLTYCNHSFHYVFVVRQVKFIINVLRTSLYCHNFENRYFNSWSHCSLWASRNLLWKLKAHIIVFNIVHFLIWNRDRENFSLCTCLHLKIRYKYRVHGSRTSASHLLESQRTS